MRLNQVEAGETAAREKCRQASISHHVLWEMMEGGAPCRFREHRPRVEGFAKTEPGSCVGEAQQATVILLLDY